MSWDRQFTFLWRKGQLVREKEVPEVNTTARPQRPSAGWRVPFPGLGNRRAELTDGGSEGVLCEALRHLLALPATSKSGVAALPDTWKLPLHPLQTSFVSKQIPVRRWRPGRRGAGALLRNTLAPQTHSSLRTDKPSRQHPSS